MPRSDFGDGLTWWVHTRFVAEAAVTEVNLASVEVFAQDVDTAEVLTFRDAVTGDLVTPMTNVRGETPATILLPRAQALVYVEGGETYLSTTPELSAFVAKVDEALERSIAAESNSASCQAASEQILAIAQQSLINAPAGAVPLVGGGTIPIHGAFPGDSLEPADLPERSFVLIGVTDPL